MIKVGFPLMSSLNAIQSVQSIFCDTLCGFCKAQAQLGQDCIYLYWTQPTLSAFLFFPLVNPGASLGAWVG